MKYLKTTGYFTKQCYNSKFYIGSFNPGIKLDILEETLEGTLASYGGNVYLITQTDPVEVINEEVFQLRYELWYEGLQTEYTFEMTSVPDIRLLGFDINKQHEFKIKMVII